MSETPDHPEAPAEPGALSYPDLLVALGFDPNAVQAVILTPTSATAIAADYPEPHTPPEAPIDSE